LYQDWVSAGQPCSPTAGINEPFICDEDAWQFIQDRSSSVPLRPFADLTYITPCGPESDHPEPNAKGSADGPEWLINLINAIGESPDWPHTAIFVVWDDWGGWYDHEPLFLNNDWVRPNPNPYNNPRDPNEWGFRVPLLVISPYIKEPGYISNGSTAPYKWRSQSVMLQFIEANFGLPLLNGDDEQQDQIDGLQDMFDMSKATPMPYVAITEPPTWSIPSPAPIGTCKSGFGGAPSERHRRMPHRHRPVHMPPVQPATSRRLLTPAQPIK
ncbi:MAG: alkaline phosphatase family protein, partial [Candidatus Cybelea sp.]